MSRKIEILKAATSLFANKGFKETSMSEVAAMAGAAGSTIFYHFKTKEDIFLAILKNIKDEILLEFEAYISRHQFSNGLEMLESTVSFYLNLASARREPFMLLHHRFPYDLAIVNSTCREHLEAIYVCFIDLFERAIRLGQEDGSIVQTSARKSAMIIFAMIDGLVRFDTFSLYEAGTLYDELLGLCRRMLQTNHSEK
jgi:AcrR family transcriptional regulator